MSSDPILESASHGAEASLRRYMELVVKTNQKMNLVSQRAVEDLWRRHIEDSAQIFPHIPSSAQNLVDIGSGAGFPGIVLAIMGVPHVHLIESIGKKARFLQSVVDELHLDATVHHTRVESLKDLKADVISARAVTALPTLLSLAKPLWHKDTVGLFLKGQKADVELTEAKKYWTFKIKKLPSLTDETGVLLKIQSLKVQNHHGNQPRKYK